MTQFKFDYELGDKIRLNCSDESGLIIGRAEYTEQSNQYFIRYQAADGRAVEDWWAEGALKPE